MRASQIAATDKVTVKIYKKHKSVDILYCQVLMSAVRP